MVRLRLSSGGKPETHRLPWNSYDTLGKSNCELDIPFPFLTPPTHSQTCECGEGGVFVAATEGVERTGPKFKSLLYAVKHVDSDEHCHRQTQCRVMVSLVYTDIARGYLHLRNHSSRIPPCS